MQIDVANRQDSHPIDADRIERAARAALQEGSFTNGELSIAVVDDPTIHRLNRESLAHDYPTDVLSFCLEEQGDRLVGEVVVSADTAQTNAVEYGWAAESELLLYVVHGVLHLVGYRDKSDEDSREMRLAEARCLERVGVQCPADHTPSEPVGDSQK